MNIPGVKQRQSGNRYYWSVVNGRLAHRVEEGHPNAVRRENKNKKIVYEEYADGITGKLIDVMIQDSDFGKQLEVRMLAGQTTHIIQFAWDSRYRNSLIEKLPYLKSGDEIELSPYSFTNEQDKKFTGVSILKDKKKMESYFKTTDLKTKKVTYVNGYPQLKKAWGEMTEREKKIFFIELDEFFEGVLNNWRLSVPSLLDREQIEDESESEPQPDDDLLF